MPGTEVWCEYASDSYLLLPVGDGRLRTSYRVAVVQFHASLESSRLTFWGSIRALRQS